MMMTRPRLQRNPSGKLTQRKFVYTARTKEQVLARVAAAAANDDEATTPRVKAGDEHGAFFRSALHAPQIAAALEIEVNTWHRAILPKSLSKRYGNRGCLMVHDEAHGSWVKYCVMGVGKVKRGKKYFFRPHRVFASKFLGISLDARLSAAAEWQVKALMLAKGGLLTTPARFFPAPDERAAKAFGFAKMSEQEQKVRDAKRSDVAALFDQPNVASLVWRSAVGMLDSIAEMRDLLLLHTDTHLVYRKDLEDGGHASLIRIDNSWLAHLCQGSLRWLCGMFGRSNPTAQDLEAVAGELRTRLYRAGLLQREHVEKRRWMFGSKWVDQANGGMTKEELLGAME